MALAINEVKISLREVNNGFGSAIKGGLIIYASNDMEDGRNRKTVCDSSLIVIGGRQFE